MRYSSVLMAVCVALAVTMISCQTEQELFEADITTVRCTIDEADEEDYATGIVYTQPATKVAFNGTKFSWSLGDKIGILPTEGAQIYFTVKEGAGTNTAKFDGGDWAMKSTGTFYGYYPLYPDIFLTKDQVPVSYIGQTQQGNNNNLHTGDYWTLYTDGTKAEGNSLNFSFHHLTAFFKTYVTVPAGTYTKIVFSSPSDVFIKEGYFDLSAESPIIVGTSFTNELCLNLQNVTFNEDTELSGYLVVAPVDITGVPITVTVYKDGEAAYEYTITKADPMVAGKTYAFRAENLTQVATSAAQANVLFASGATAVTITEPLTEDATVVLPNTEDAVALSLPTTASTSKLTVSYPQDATSNPATLSITGPEGADLDIQTPNTTVTINGISYDHITSRTAASTCIISEGVSVNVLKVIQGGVQVYGTVSQIDLSEQEDDCIVNVSGTVDSLLGEDDEEYVPATSVSLNKSSINLNVGDSETLTATVAPVGAYPNVIWSSSDETIATVSADGIVTATAEGTATITARTICGGFMATCDIIVNLPADTNLPEGALPGLVSVGFNKKVYFSKGNLQYKENTWGFANSQFEVLGDLFSYGEKEDLFCWSSDGRSNYGRSTQTASSYFDGLFLDWGTAIDNNSTWRTLSSDEWKYVLGTSSERLGKYKNWVCVNGVYGLVIAPDEYCGTIEDTYDEEAWATAERDGLVFLPISGYRYGGTQIGLTDYGYYWSSTSTSQYDQWADVLSINSSDYGVGKTYRRYACCVRLVSDCGDASITPAPTLKNGYEYVDLGLPSGLKWATMNLGASSPKEIGDKYAWGETSSKDDYTWNNYKYGGYDPDDNDYTLMYKYCVNSNAGNVDGKTVLEQADDAAYVNWGEGWRMPRDNEWNELITNCTWIWTKINSVNGYLIVGPNGKRIFIPMTDDLYDSNKRGVYWSSSLETGGWDDSARTLHFTNSWYTISTAESYNRCYGYSIRPVTN